MEAEKNYIPEITQEGVGAERTKSILDESLSGKTEDELTPEQQEAELEFELKNLESFLEEIDKEEVMAHGTREKITAMLVIGIKSHTQRSSGKIKDPELAKIAEGSGMGDPIWQGISAEFVLEKAILPYAKLLMEKPDETTLTNKKEELLRGLPKIGRKRVEWFLNNTVPKIVDAGFNPYFFSYGIDNTSEGNAIFNKWYDLATMVAGEDLISTTPARYLKQKFIRAGPTKPMSHYGNVVIYFDNPQEIRMYNLGHATFTDKGTTKWDEEEYDSDDIGVSSTIIPSHFRAIRFGTYDRKNRTLYLPGIVGVDDLAKLIEFQNRGVSLFDESLIALPPLESIRVIDPGYEVIPGNGLMRRIDHPNPEQKLVYGHIDEIKGKNNIDSYEMIAGIIEKKGYKWERGQKVE